LNFNKQVFLSALTVVLLAVLICFRFFGEIILHPDEFLFGPSGDGLKNYFSVAYQVIHGDGLWFNGMLYPYGDHLIFADGQPLLTKILQFFIEPDVSNGPKIIAIMNLLMIGSLVITAWCIHRLLVWNYVNPWFTVPFALAIAFLSPQIGRFTGHYALGYTFFVPMSWLLIASFSRSKWPWLIALITSAFVFAFGFLHPYYLFIFVVFLGSIIGWETILKHFQFLEVERMLPKLFTLIVPLLAFMLYNKWVDPYTDRPTTPGGMYGFMSTFHSVFLPTAQSIQNLFIQYSRGIYRPSSWEGNGFVGFVPTLLALGSLLTLIKKARRKQWKPFTNPMLPPTLKAVFIPSIIVLLFSMGLFHKLGLNWLSDFIQPLKQFRSLGRLVWVFYYVLSVWAVFHLYALYRLFKRIDNGKLKLHAKLMIVLSIAIWSFDATLNTNQSRSAMTNRSAMEIFTDKCASNWRSAGVNIQEYQAILPLPLRLIGSEKISLFNGSHALVLAMNASFSTGLPIIGGAMSRTSLAVTEKTAQLVANPLFPRPILDDLYSDGKLLLLHSKESLSTAEARLINLGELVFSNNDYKIYSVSLKEIRQTYDDLQTIPDSVYMLEVHYRIPSQHECITDSLWGEPAYRLNDGDAVFDTIIRTNDPLNISFWLRVNPDDDLLPGRKYSINGSQVIGGMLGWDPNLLDGWLYVSEELPVKPGKPHRYTLEARSGVVSRIMLRNSEQTIYHIEDDGSAFVNNVPNP